MKIKYIFISLICFMFGISFVNAKRIEYNLTIDKNLKFSENNIYNINVVNKMYTFELRSCMP